MRFKLFFRSCQLFPPGLSAKFWAVRFKTNFPDLGASFDVGSKKCNYNINRVSRRKFCSWVYLRHLLRDVVAFTVVLSLFSQREKFFSVPRSCYRITFIAPSSTSALLQRAEKAANGAAEMVELSRLIRRASRRNRDDVKLRRVAAKKRALICGDAVINN